MPTVAIEQALFLQRGPGLGQIVGRSPGFAEEWIPPAEKACKGFGHPPAGATCPAAVLALPLTPHVVGIFQVTAVTAGIVGFRVLALPMQGYSDWIGDPFVVAEHFPPPWHARGELAALSWDQPPSVSRSVEAIQSILKRPEGPALLGATQALVDGAQVKFERLGSDDKLAKSLWALLPNSTRNHLWPASFAFSDDLKFDVLVVPPGTAKGSTPYLTEKQAEIYPEGRYELNLQIAAEAGNQADLDALFGRRGRKQTMRLGLILLVIVVVLTVAMQLFMAMTAPRPKAKGAPNNQKAAKGIASLNNWR